MIAEANTELSPLQVTVVWAFTVITFLCGMITAGGVLIEPNAGVFFVIPFALLNFPLAVGTLCCGGYLLVRRQVAFAVVVLLSGTWGFVMSLLFMGII